MRSTSRLHAVVFVLSIACTACGSTNSTGHADGHVAATGTKADADTAAAIDAAGQRLLRETMRAAAGDSGFALAADEMHPVRISFPRDAPGNDGSFDSRSEHARITGRLTADYDAEPGGASYDAAMAGAGSSGVAVLVTPEMYVTRGGFEFSGTVEVDGRRYRFSEGSVLTRSSACEPLFAVGTRCIVDRRPFVRSADGWVPASR